MLRSSREQPKPEAPGSKSTPGWQPNLRQEARQNQSGRNRLWHFQLSPGILRFAVVCFSQNWAMSPSLSQLFVATAQSQSQLVLQFVKVVKFPLYVGQLFLQSALHRCTRLHAVPSQPQEPSNLAEFESQTLYAADKSQRLNVVLAVLAEAPLCSWGARQQGVALVETNRVNAQTDLLRDGADLHDHSSSVEATPWSQVQSQAQFSTFGLGFLETRDVP